MPDKYELSARLLLYTGVHKYSKSELFLLKTHKQHQQLFDVIIQELAAPIMDANDREVFKGRVRAVLKQKFQTIGELLRFTSKRGWNRLNYFGGMGPITYNEIINTLGNKHFIMQGDDGYISVAPQLAALLL